MGVHITTVLPSTTVVSKISSGPHVGPGSEIHTNSSFPFIFIIVNTYPNAHSDEGTEGVDGDDSVSVEGLDDDSVLGEHTTTVLPSTTIVSNLSSGPHVGPGSKTHTNSSFPFILIIVNTYPNSHYVGWGG